MARTRITQSALIYASDAYDDTIAPSLANFETNPINAEEDFNNVRSMLSELRDVQAGNWYDALVAPATLEAGAIRGVQNINDALHLVEKKRVLSCTWNLTDIAVPASASAAATLTNATNFLNTETVTIDGKIYTFQTALTDVDGNVQIGATVALSHENLRRAINLDGVAGTDYAASMTLHSTVSATDGATTTVVTAKTPGTAGNAIAVSEATATGSWGAANLAGGAGDVVILGAGELPSNTTAAVGAVTTLGTVVAAHGGTFGQHALSEVAGSTAISPKNLMQIVDGDSRDPILSGGRQVYGLLQGESGVTDGATITDATTTRVQVSFVRINATGDDLEAAPATDIGAATVNYCSVTRVRFEDLAEDNFLGGASIDVPAGTTVTRQVGYDNQGTTPVDLTTNATLDLEGPGLVWAVRDDLEAILFRVVEGSAGGTSEFQLGSDVDVFNVDAIVNDFANGARIDTAGERIDIGENAGTIESTGANDLTLLGAGELLLDDGNQVGSTWVQTGGVKLSDTTAEWDAFEVAFGETSLLDAIVQASQVVNRTRVDAIVTANVAADNDVNGPGGANNLDVDLPAYDQVTFLTDVDAYVNGVMLRNGVNAAADQDVSPGTSPAAGDLRFAFPLKGTGTKTDVLTVVVNGQ
jgi:hypothetical protein